MNLFRILAVLLPPILLPVVVLGAVRFIEFLAGAKFSANDVALAALAPGLFFGSVISSAFILIFAAIDGDKK